MKLKGTSHDYINANFVNVSKVAFIIIYVLGSVVFQSFTQLSSADDFLLNAGVIFSCEEYTVVTQTVVIVRCTITSVS